MEPIEVLKSLLDWGKRIQFAAQVVVFLCSASVVACVRGMLVSWTHIPSLWQLPIYLACAALAIMLFSAAGRWISGRVAVNAGSTETKKILEAVMIAGAEFAVYDLLQGRAKALSLQLEELWHSWNNEGERLIHPLTLKDTLGNYSAKNAGKLIDGRRDFLVLYSHHIVTMKSLIPDFKSRVVEVGYPSELPYVDVRSALADHADELGKKSNKAWEKYGRPLDTLK
ncbi:hypothetical protein FTO74_04710 [Granulicella sp. WH15]|uniref:hypothetical protein n=1 Tax=Granulicella sp. WH15 TaxID=2602070 RepID=UPI0013678A13|nr:hypothetical protein [Granulicella sp. WH15]QHN02746.1 hypothetical protein FTO74_04710 [Granulicella sp. WH15]